MHALLAHAYAFLRPFVLVFLAGLVANNFPGTTIIPYNGTAYNMLGDVLTGVCAGTILPDVSVKGLIFTSNQNIKSAKARA